MVKNKFSLLIVCMALSMSLVSCRNSDTKNQNDVNYSNNDNEIKDDFTSKKITTCPGYSKVRNGRDMQVSNEANLYQFDDRYCYTVLENGEPWGVAIWITKEGKVYFENRQGDLITTGLTFDFEKLDDDRSFADVYVGEYKDNKYARGLHTWCYYKYGDRLSVDKQYASSHLEPGNGDPEYVAMQDYDNVSYDACDILVIDEDGNEEVVAKYKAHTITPELYGVNLLGVNWGVKLAAEVEVHTDKWASFGEANGKSEICFSNATISYNIGLRVPIKEVIYDFKRNVIHIEEQYHTTTLYVDKLVGNFE